MPAFEMFMRNYFLQFLVLGGSIFLVTNGVAGGQNAIEVPFPEFAPHPSSSLLYCRSIASTEIVGNSSASVKATNTAEGKSSLSNSYIRLTWESQGLYVAAAEKNGGDDEVKFLNPQHFQILNNKPTEYYAASDQTVGHGQGGFGSLALNRLNGHLIFTRQAGSIVGNFPGIISEYYTCSSRLPRGKRKTVPSF